MISSSRSILNSFRLFESLLTADVHSVRHKPDTNKNDAPKSNIKKTVSGVEKD